ncbi:hypothetical protein Q0590_25130 [Rhodocytophaga aerolata]|uniref:Uncharacterized protein n=1 Tax=Rhodocytophaga aerolata TaxID=455078 RepID=A0ABT8RBV1_9BACT|nr:hypothetical protein [Rhodocytophaga aerolata]MDO1449585.1 hypothetical protein [Rhodocytophaga aerolata]
MATLQHIQLVLTNESDMPKTWNIGGGAMQETVLTSRQGYIGASGEGAGKFNYIGLAQAGELPMAYIGQVGEGAPTQSDLITAAQIEKLNASMYASPFKCNKIRLYTNNADQLVEKFTYYKQTATGTYQTELLDFLSKYVETSIRIIVELDKDDIGTIILDINKKFEVVVLPRTILLLDLFYESEEDGLGFEEPSQDFLDPDDDEEEKDKDSDKPEEKKEINLQEVELFVKTYFKYVRAYQDKARVPVLFSLAEAAMLTDYSVNRPGENLYDKVVTSKWQGETVWVEKQVKGVKETIEEKIIKEISNELFLVKKQLRAYQSPTYSIADQYARLHKDERFTQVFNFSSLPYSFAGALAESGYSKSEQFLENIEHTMQILEPYVLQQERSLDEQKKASERYKVVLLASAAVLFFVLFSLIVKPAWVAKLL